MKKLPHHGLEKLAEAAANIESTYAEIEELFTSFASECERLWLELDGFQQDAARVLDDAATEAELYFDERSEKWQEGEAGERYAEWRDELRRLADDLNEDTERPDIETPERPDWLGEITEANFAELSE
jgi:hypothetical protein